MHRAFGKRNFTLLVLSVLICMISCGHKTDEDLIRELMEDVGKCVEKKDLSNLLAFLSEDFSDFRGRNKDQTKDMVQSYFHQFRGIVIHILHTRIDDVKAQEASVQSDIAFSSGAARALRKLVRVSTDNYRFNIKLIKKENRWLIRYAEWTYIGLDELFPESLAILKKIFSDE